MERESVHVNITGSSNDAKVAIPLEFEEVEKDDDLGRSDERALKVNADRGGGIGILPEIAHVFTSEKIQITGCEGEHIIDASVELGTFRCDEATVGPIFCEERDRRPDENRAVFVHI